MNLVEQGSVAIIDDEADIRTALRQMFALEQLSSIDFADGESALAVIDQTFLGIVITDLRMPGMDGNAVFNRLRQIDPELPVIILSGHGDLAIAVDLVKRGAYDFLSKPFDADTLIAVAQRALEKRSLVLENRRLREATLVTEQDGILGESPEIEHFRQTLAQLVQADIDVLITGESGSGKSLAAAALHRRSPRARKPMVMVDCGALQADHAESLLFGHVSAAFPAAQFPHTGQLTRADGGTLFLDHVDCLMPNLQARLLHVLENRIVLPMGGHQPQNSIFRTISASNTDLQSKMESGAFDRSLYFRLNSFRLEMPPLHARKGDVVPLFRAFLAKASNELKRQPPPLSPSVWRKLQDHDWPGNVRELKNFAANVALGLSEGQAPLAEIAGDPQLGLKEAMAIFEADMIRKAMDRNNGNIPAVIAALNLPRKTLYDKLARHKIEPDDYRPSRSKRMPG